MLSAELIESAGLSDRIDDLSTRLILDGAASLGPADLEELSRSAAEQGHVRAAEAAQRAAEALTSAEARCSGPSIPERTGLLSHALMEIRRLLDEVEADVEPAAEVHGAALDAEPAGAELAGAASLAVIPLHAALLHANPLAADKELILDFINESNEHLATIEGQLLILENDHSAVETLNSIFRGFHTIKGLAGFLEFGDVQALAHEVETLLDLARAGQLRITPAVVDIILESTDIVRAEVASVRQRLAGDIAAPTRVDAVLLQRIRDVAAGGSAAPAAELALEAAGSVTAEREGIAQELAVQELAVQESATGQELAAQPEMAAVPAPAARAWGRRSSDMAKVADPTSVRIDTGKLDQLMDMVGEMVIAQTLIGHSPALAALKDTRLTRNLGQLARITADVQRIATGMRMVPIGLQFQKTARLVRDLSRRAGKQIVLETSGEDTELDKTIAEELSDPLLHMVRNSIDHGIEEPEERARAGKEPVARIRIAAYHQSGQIVVAISDDGRGLNRERILAKARKNGLIQPGAQLSDAEIFHLIFEAGFSTAEKVTDISGRGVGMDVVRKHVQKLRGRIDIQSREGEGTTFLIKLPLTLAIIEGLVVVVGPNRYIVPIFSVREMFRPKPEMLSTVQGKGEMALVRGGLLPVIRLYQRFGVEPRTTVLTEGTLIVAESEGRQFCLLVDDLIGKQDVVIKSLGQGFKHVTGVAGCAILGDGRVGLILDVDGIYRGRA